MSKVARLQSKLFIALFMHTSFSLLVVEFIFTTLGGIACFYWSSNLYFLTAAAYYSLEHLSVIKAVIAELEPQSSAL